MNKKTKKNSKTNSKNINIINVFDENDIDRKNGDEKKSIIYINKIFNDKIDIVDVLEEVVSYIPSCFNLPHSVKAKITYNGAEYNSYNDDEFNIVLKREFETINNNSLVFEIYLDNEYNQDEHLLREEKINFNNIAELIIKNINTCIGKHIIYEKHNKIDDDESNCLIQSAPTSSRNLLNKFLVKQNNYRDIYHDLIPFRVKDILLVATFYDAFIIEREGRLFEKISGEYFQLNLSSVPRITGVSTPDEALEQLLDKKFDLVIIMMGVDKESPIDLAQVIKMIYPNLPVLMLLNNNSDISIFEKNTSLSKAIDKVFIWNGDSKVFLAMIKYIEDKRNVECDTKIGLVRVILLVEDSAKYYSRYLPILYSTIIEQTQKLIKEVHLDEFDKLLRMRVRPKIILAQNYEEAIDIINKYKEFLLCVITDVKYEIDGVVDDTAGLKLVKYVKDNIKDLPTLVQSSDSSNQQKAFHLKSGFIDKNSNSLQQDLITFIHNYLGFGNFIFKNLEGAEIATATNLKEFIDYLKIIPEDTLIFHGKRNHFSNWLMARGEIQIAAKLKPVKVNDFKDSMDLRKYIVEIINQYIYEKNKGKVVNFEETTITDDSTIVSLASGSLGGKGRGLAFINTLIHNFDFSELIPDIKVKTPITSIIGTDEFEQFLRHNKLSEIVYTETDYEKLKQYFLKSELSAELIEKLKIYLKVVNKPIAVRSSSLFEDSLMQPFAGIFDTFLLPNNNAKINIRLKEITDAIKLVYASIFSPTARSYFEAINYKIEEEKMAVIIQEVVGKQYENAYYPHISGVAQSFNFYPFSYMKPDEGFAVMAVGLGKYVVDGEKTYRFSPVHPNLEISTPKDLYKNTQLHFLAVDLEKQEINLLEGETAGLTKLEIEYAENFGTLKHCASVYDLTNERIVPGLDQPGPRVINFANILKYNYIPLASTIRNIMDIVKEAMGSPVEIEFAVDLEKDKNEMASFYLLQIKPLIKSSTEANIDMQKINYDKLVMYSEKGMGNGLINDITDFIYIDISKFNKLKTEKMRDEINFLNAEMVKENRKYILIGPGRWGTRDRFIGIPVSWSQISNAKIIVEISLEDFNLDASLGSHFFHNVISMNVGYFSVVHNSLIDYINWDLLNSQPIINETKYFRHIRFERPVNILMDGKKRAAMISVE